MSEQASIDDRGEMSRPDEKAAKVETKPQPALIPWTERELAALEPEIAELAAAEQKAANARLRILRIAGALRPGYDINLARRCWLVPECSAEKGE